MLIILSQLKIVVSLYEHVAINNNNRFKVFLKFYTLKQFLTNVERF